MEKTSELWDLYTAKAEYNSLLKDKFDRHPYWASKNKSILSPKVSEYLIASGLNPHYPNNKKFALCLTHDVDNLYNNYTTKQLAVKGIKSLLTFNLREVNKTIRHKIKREIDPNYHISETLKHGNKYNAKSSFYFLSLSKEEQDYNYDLSEIAETFDLIRYNKGEIGLHGGHLAYNNLLKIKQEKEKLEKIIGEKVEGYRNHYLKFETPTTWEFLDELQFKYDTTFGYADCAGFRNGMCHPFQPYSLNQNRFLDTYELPLVIMDCSLWAYMNISSHKQLAFCKKLIDRVAHNKGVLTLLWHNTVMQGAEGQLYNEILKYAHEKEAWMPTGSEIIDYWQENKFQEKARNLLKEMHVA